MQLYCLEKSIISFGGKDISIRTAFELIKMSLECFSRVTVYDSEFILCFYN